jgi:hypothetical protein
MSSPVPSSCGFLFLMFLSSFHSVNMLNTTGFIFGPVWIHSFILIWLHLLFCPSKCILPLVNSISSAALLVQCFAFIVHHSLSYKSAGEDRVLLLHCRHYSPWWTLAPVLQFISHSQSVRLFGLGISPSQCHYLHRTRQIQNKCIHVSNGIQILDPSVWVGKHSSCLGPCGHCDLQRQGILILVCFWNRS